MSVQKMRKKSKVKYIKNIKEQKAEKNILLQIKLVVKYNRD